MRGSATESRIRRRFHCVHARASGLLVSKASTPVGFSPRPMSSGVACPSLPRMCSCGVDTDDFPAWRRWSDREAASPARTQRRESPVPAISLVTLTLCGRPFCWVSHRYCGQRSNSFVESLDPRTSRSLDSPQAKAGRLAFRRPAVPELVTTKARVKSDSSDSDRGWGRPLRPPMRVTVFPLFTSGSANAASRQDHVRGLAGPVAGSRRAA